MALSFDELEKISLKAKNYKCLGGVEQGFDVIKPINIIIGRNNSGKSTLLDLIEMAIHYSPGGGASGGLIGLGHKGNTPEIVVSHPLSAGEIRAVFRSSTSGGHLHGRGDHFQYGKDWIGAVCAYQFSIDNPTARGFLSLTPHLSRIDAESQKHFNTQLAQAARYPFENITVKRLLADRDIQSEKVSSSLEIEPNGRQLTNVFRKILNTNTDPSELIEETFLNELNKITRPDIEFTRISVQEKGTGEWEIYLHESGKGRIPLSHTGSGLKTVLLTLAFIHLFPFLEKKKIEDYFFCLEELENNLHPSILRRLLLYIKEVSDKHRGVFFITTHSNVVIDLFSKDEEAQIIHVQHDGLTAEAKGVKTYVEHKDILDDLDVRASDLLQSNGIVWVEGPSDRLYFNHWIDLMSDGALMEGAHYQCIFYGGRLLSHLSGDDPEIDVNECIKILGVNRNAILIADSDRQSGSDDINETKKRLVKELEKIGGYPWVTEGREIENYIPMPALKEFFEKPYLPTLKKNQKFSDYLDNEVKKGEGVKFKRSKVLFAEKISPYVTKEDIRETHDLYGRMEEVVKIIKGWNSIEGG